MNLDNTYGLLNILEFLWNHFNNLFLAESECQNSNVGGKQIEKSEMRKGMTNFVICKWGLRT